MNMRLRQMTCVFLISGSDMLLMKRAETMQIAPGLWAGVGGHLEPAEISDPMLCALREMEEETGITPDRIRDLRLQAVVMRQRPNEIRMQYIYFGATDMRELGETLEGTLHWIPCAEVLSKSMSAASRFILEKYFREGLSGLVWVGALGSDDGQPMIQWSLLQDWESGGQTLLTGENGRSHQTGLTLLVLRSDNLEALVKFYNLLGLRFQQERHGKGPVHYSSILGQTILELYPLTEGEIIDTRHRLGFCVEDLSTTLEQLQRGGMIANSKILDDEYGYRLTVRDPDGRTIELTQSRENNQK